MRALSSEAKLYEFVIRALAVIILTTWTVIFAAAQKPSFGAEAVANNTFQIETSKGAIYAAESGRDEIMVRYDGRAIEVTMAGLENAGPKISQQFATIIAMAYDAGTHSEFARAYKIWVDECGCGKQDSEVNKQYFRKSWWVRKRLKKILPPPVIEELAQTMLIPDVGGGKVVIR